MSLRSLLQRAPVIPVLVVDDVAHAQPLAHALVAGGLPVLEVTLRTPVALDVVAEMTKVEGAIVGIGTARNPADVQRAADVGAQFAVSPGLTPTLRAADHAIPLLPGVATAGEAMTAADAGYDTLKCFPAAAVGGMALLKALASPLPDLKFCPTGGVREDTLQGWLQLPNVICVGGSWLVTPKQLADGDWSAITAAAERACALAAGQPPAAPATAPSSALGEEDPGAALEMTTTEDPGKDKRHE